MPLRRRKALKVQYISETVRNNLEDLKHLYIRGHGAISEWSDNIKQIFFLNCDIELENLCRNFKITPSEKCYELGLSYGIMVLQTCLAEDFINLRGVDEIHHLCLGDREILNHKINESIYNYIMDGRDI